MMKKWTKEREELVLSKDLNWLYNQCLVFPPFRKKKTSMEKGDKAGKPHAHLEAIPATAV